MVRVKWTGHSNHPQTGVHQARPTIRYREGARGPLRSRVHARLISQSGEVGEILRGESDQTSSDVLLQMDQGAGAGDGQGDRRESQEPGQGNLRDGDAVAGRDPGLAGIVEVAPAA